MSSPALRAAILLFALILCLTMSAPPAQADPPATISYQGEIYDSQGQPVTGTVDLVVAIYDSAEGQYSLWSDVFSVEVADGVFSVVLGSQTPLDLDFDQPYWLGVTVGADPEMTPRTPLSSAPYALRAVNAEQAYTATAVESSAAVTSFNAATGAMTIAGTAPISVDTTDQTITISSSAVTSVTAGTGLTDSGTAGDPVLAVEYGGDGSNDTAARSDHVHDGRYYQKTDLQTAGLAEVHWDNLTNKPTLVGPYANLVVVAKSGGQFTTIQAACDSITDASESNPYLVWVGPGEYNEQVKPPDYVSVQGSGRDVTIVTAPAGLNYAWVSGDHCRVSDLTLIANQASQAVAGGFRLKSSLSLHVERVDLEMTLESVTDVAGFYCASGSTLELNQVSITISADAASGRSNAIYAQNVALEADRVSIQVAGGNKAYGLYYVASDTDQVYEAVLNDCYFNASGAASVNKAIQIDAESVLAGGESRVRVRDSRLVGTGAAVFTDTGNCTALLAGCELDGGVSGNGTTTCASCFDGSYAALGTDCQAIP